MNVLKRYQLKRRQRTLIQKRDIYEQLQTEYNGDEYYYRYTQLKMDAIDEEAEHIRGILEGRWKE